MNMAGGFVRHVRPGELARVFAVEGEQPGEAPPTEAPHVMELPSGRKPDGPERQLELF
jgi:hypothetical protein